MTRTAPLWALCSLNDEALPESTPPDFSFDYVDISNVTEGTISNELESFSFKEAPSRARRLSSAGDVIVSTVRTYLRAIAEVGGHEGIRVYSTGFAVLRPTSATDSRFLAYALSSNQVMDEIIATSVGVSYPAIQGAALHRIRVPHHDLNSQCAIANYLDHETAEIDLMIGKMDELVAGIERRRQQAILNAIASDRSIAIGLLVDVTLGKMLQTSSSSEHDELRPYLRAAHVQPNGVLDLSVEPHEMWFSPADVRRLTLEEGDVVVVEGGVGGYGRAAYVATDLMGVGFQNSIIRLRGSSKEDGKFLAHVLVAARNSGLIEQACLNVAMPHFTAEKVGRFRVPFHEATERARIAEHLDDVTSKIDAMLAKVADLKSLLIERRSALVTDVVTGRKKVA